MFVDTFVRYMISLVCTIESTTQIFRGNQAFSHRYISNKRRAGLARIASKVACHTGTSTDNVW